VEANAAADLAAEYWLIDPAEPADTRRIAFLEPKLIGTQTRLSSFLLAIEALDERIETKQAREKLARAESVQDVSRAGSSAGS
jgi:hypothetical protein